VAFEEKIFMEVDSHEVGYEESMNSKVYNSYDFISDINNSISTIYSIMWGRGGYRGSQ